jgi:hypothetical protein
MSNLTDFFPSGGGGLTPKFQEFNASGTFTPTQALIDAGGYIEVFLVAGGGGGRNVNTFGGAGGEVVQKQMYLNNTSALSITIGAGGAVASTGGTGGNSLFQGSTSGGIDLTAIGGAGSSTGGGNDWPQTAKTNGMQQGLGSFNRASDEAAGSQQAAGFGINGYGGGGPNNSTSFPINGTPNSGQGGISSQTAAYQRDGMSGYCLIKWYE